MFLEVWHLHSCWQCCASFGVVLTALLLVWCSVGSWHNMFCLMWPFSNFLRLSHEPALKLIEAALPVSAACFETCVYFLTPLWSCSETVLKILWTNSEPWCIFLKLHTIAMRLNVCSEPCFMMLWNLSETLCHNSETCCVCLRPIHSCYESCLKLSDSILTCCVLPDAFVRPALKQLWNLQNQFWNLLLLLKPIYSFSETALKLYEPIRKLDLSFETWLTLLWTLCVTLWNNSETCLLSLKPLESAQTTFWNFMITLSDTFNCFWNLSEPVLKPFPNFMEQVCNLPCSANAGKCVSLTLSVLLWNLLEWLCSPFELPETALKRFWHVQQLLCKPFLKQSESLSEVTYIIFLAASCLKLPGQAMPPKKQSFDDAWLESIAGGVWSLTEEFQSAVFY